jgi:hypothetical protein
MEQFKKEIKEQDNFIVKLQGYPYTREIVPGISYPIYV